MDRKWLPLNALRAFEAAGQHLSFTAAANSLTVAQSDRLRTGMEMELVLVPLRTNDDGDEVMTFAFRPVS